MCDHVTGLVVFDATDSNFYTGHLSPQFDEESVGGTRPWFFQPDDWMPNKPDKAWYGSIWNTRCKVLMCYSTGHATQAEAQAAADEWFKKIQRKAEEPALW